MSASSGSTTATDSVLTLGPRAVERPADAGHTLIRILDDPAPDQLDHGGLLAPAGAGCSIDWWIGGDDRWYFPAREATIRQRRLGVGPVIETAVRIPSGDATQRCYAVNTPKGKATVIEITNDSTIPVALALAIRPYGLDGVGEARTIRLDGERILVDGRVVLMLPRRPNESRADGSVDLADVLVAGTALNGAREASGSGANLTVLYPLPHTTTLRFLVPGPEGAAPDVIPDADQVSSGWETMLEPGGRFSFPDDGISERTAAARIRLSLATDDLDRAVVALEPGAGRVLEALAVSGANRDVAPVLGALADSFPTRLEHGPRAAATVIAGACRAAVYLGDRARAETLLEPLLKILKLVEKTKDRAASIEALGSMATLLDFLGQPDAVADLSKARAKLVSKHGADRADDEGLPADLTELNTLGERASSTNSWGGDELDPALRYWLGARNLLIDDSRQHELDLLPVFPTAWRGGSLEVLGAATRFGPASFAIRWHGARPALLWDVEADAGHGPITLRCSGLDPAFAVTDLKGETLLAGAAEELPDAPAEGQSFS